MSQARGGIGAGSPWRFRFGEEIAPLAALLARGGVVAIPTESSYGLAADPASERGIAAIYRIKGRESGKALPVVVAGVGQLSRLGIDPGLPILKALSALWPGPLSAVLPMALPLPASAGEASLAVRVPAHPGLLHLLAALGYGVTATSANRSGGEAILDPAEAFALLAGEDAAVVDDGILPGGLPSTLIAPAAAGHGFEVLRAGGFPLDRLRDGWFREAPIGSPARRGEKGSRVE